MGRSIAEVIALFNERKQRDSLTLARRFETKDVYNGDVYIPLPEMDKDEKPAIANLLAQGLDQMSMRISSTQPSCFFPPLEEGVKREVKAATQRRQAVQSWWNLNRLKTMDRRRARHLIGYGFSPVQIRPNHQRGIPEWVIRDPLSTYPAPCTNPDDVTPEDCIFSYHQPLKWIYDNYPDVARKIAKHEDAKPDQLFQIVEYVDAEECILILMGKEVGHNDYTIKGSEVELLARYPNRAEVCPIVIPGRINLDRNKGQFDGMIGMYQLQAKLQALSVIATEKGIFKDEWVIARPGEVPRIVVPADGRRGVVGVISGGDIKESGTDPGYQTNPMQDRLERNQRLDGGIPAQFGGETVSNVRTGRMSEAIVSGVVDFPIQEAQESMAAARLEENKRAIAIDKAYWKGPRSFYVNWQGKSDRVDYVPQKLWVSDEHNVQYSYAGADASQLTIIAGQLVGTELISKHQARVMHPMVEDPELMHDQILGERLEAAQLASLEQMASQGQIPPADLARITSLIVTDKQELAGAILTVQREAQERQASQDAQGNSVAVDPQSPEAQPGLAPPGVGAEAGQIAAPSNSISNLSQLFGQLRGPQKTVASERPQAPANA